MSIMDKTYKENKMKEYSATYLRNNSSTVYSEVQRSGQARITSANRPDMVIITQEKLDGILRKKK